MSENDKISEELEVVTPRVNAWIRAGFGCGMAVIIWVIWMIVIMIISASTNSEYMAVGINPRQGFYEFIFSFLFCIGTWAIIDRKNWIRETGISVSKWVVPHWISGAVFGIIGVAVAVLIIEIFGSVELVEGRPTQVYLPHWSWSEMVLLMVLYAGSEELFARGLLYPFLHRYVGFVWAVILSSVIFSLLHLGNNSFDILPAVDIFVAGILLALLREYTGTLWLAWGVHFGWNFGLVAAGLPVSGYTFLIKTQTYYLVTNGPDHITGGDFGPEGGLAGISANLLMVAVVIVLIILKKRKSTSI